MTAPSVPGKWAIVRFVGGFPVRSSIAAIGGMVLLGLGGCTAPPSVAEPDGGSGSSGWVASSGSDDATPEPTLCTPGATRACYEGPFGTADVGQCRSGQQVCAADGQQWSACEGEVWPAEAEQCDTPQDDDCDGSSMCHPQVEWSRSIPGYIRWLDAAQAGGVVAIGYGDGELDGLELYGSFVLGLDAAGQVQWEFHIPGFDVEIHAMETDPTGDVVFVGRFAGEPDFGGGPVPSSVGLDSFAVRYDADGNHEWSHTLSPSGYLEVAVDDQGWTFVMGENIFLTIDEQPVQGTFFVAALDPGGEFAWVVTGSGAFLLSPYVSLSVNDAGEVMALLVIADSGEPEFGGVPLELGGGASPVALWLDHDGEVLGHHLFEAGPVGADRMAGYGRSDGWVALVDTYNSVDEVYHEQILMTAFDTRRQLQSSTFLGRSALISRVDAYGPTDTALALEFQGALELGPVGVAGQPYQWRDAVAVLDDLGQARFIEVLNGFDYTDISGVATAPDGSIFVGGDAGGTGTLAGHEVTGRFIAKLRL